VDVNEHGQRTGQHDPRMELNGVLHRHPAVEAVHHVAHEVQAVGDCAHQKEGAHKENCTALEGDAFDVRALAHGVLPFVPATIKAKIWLNVKQFCISKENFGSQKIFLKELI